MAEKNSQKSQSSRSWLGPLLKPLRPAFREVVAMSLFINILALALPVFILQVYDRVVFYQGLSTLKALMIGVVIAIGFDREHAREFPRESLRGVD